MMTVLECIFLFVIIFLILERYFIAKKRQVVCIKNSSSYNIRAVCIEIVSAYNSQVVQIHPDSCDEALAKFKHDVDIKFPTLRNHKNNTDTLFEWNHDCNEFNVIMKLEKLKKKIEEWFPGVIFIETDVSHLFICPKEFK